MKTPKATDFATKPKMHKSLFNEREAEVTAAVTGEMPDINVNGGMLRSQMSNYKPNRTSNSFYKPGQPPVHSALANVKPLIKFIQKTPNVATDYRRLKEAAATTTTDHLCKIGADRASQRKANGHESINPPVPKISDSDI